MKLIIDIPEEEYKMRTIWAKSDSLCSPDTLLIAKGVPYEEIPQGYWIEDSGNIACSNCHTIWLYRRTDFCPNCGADMRKGDSNG